MGLGPDLSTINIGTIRGASLDLGLQSGSMFDLADQLEGVHGRTTTSWSGPASSAFGEHLNTRVQGLRLGGQALQQKAAFLNAYADGLQGAQQQWNSAKARLQGLPGPLQAQALSGGELSTAGLNIANPLEAAALIGQAVVAVGELIAAQVKAQAAGVELAQNLQGLQGLVDDLQSLLGGSQSHAQAAGVTPAEMPPLGSAPFALGGGLGAFVGNQMTAGDPQPWIETIPIEDPEPWIETIPIGEQGPWIETIPIEEQGPWIETIPIEEPGPWIETIPIEEPGPSIVKNDPGKNEGEGEGQGQGDGQGEGEGSQTTPTTPTQQPPFPPPTEVTGATQHGQDQISGRDGGHGVNDGAIGDAVKDPEKPPEYQPDTQTYKYIGKDATVILNQKGQVVTGWARNRNGWRNP